MTTFVTMSHPDGGYADTVPEQAVSHYAALGWLLEDAAEVPVEGSPRAPKEMPRPQRNDKTAAWRTYAVAVHDMPVADALAKSRDELIELYGDKPEPAPAPTPSTSTATDTATNNKEN